MQRGFGWLLGGSLAFPRRTLVLGVTANAVVPIPDGKLELYEGELRRAARGTAQL